MRLGYQVLEFYHWKERIQYDHENKEGGLFSNYINTFLKYKQEASGPTDWIQTPDDTQKYIGQYFEKEGVRLDRDKIKKNKGLRALAKLILKSFWERLDNGAKPKTVTFLPRDGGG